MWFESIKKLFADLFENKSGITYKYNPVEEICGKMTPEQVLELIMPIVAEANLYHQAEETVITPSFPILQENSETGHHIWSVILLYEKIKGKQVKQDEPKIYLYLSVDDKNGEIGRTYPR